MLRPSIRRYHGPDVEAGLRLARVVGGGLSRALAILLLRLVVLVTEEFWTGLT